MEDNKIESQPETLTVQQQLAHLQQLQYDAFFQALLARLDAREAHLNELIKAYEEFDLEAIEREKKLIQAHRILVNANYHQKTCPTLQKYTRSSEGFKLQ